MQNKNAEFHVMLVSFLKNSECMLEDVQIRSLIPFSHSVLVCLFYVFYLFHVDATVRVCARCQSSGYAVF